jgi:hypothetical protein
LVTSNTYTCQLSLLNDIDLVATDTLAGCTSNAKLNVTVCTWPTRLVYDRPL